MASLDISGTSITRRRFMGGAAALTGASVLTSIPVLAAGEGAEIENVLVMTSVRNGELSLRIDYRLLVPQAGASFTVQVLELGGTTAGLPAGTFPLTETEVGIWRQTVKISWADPHLWDVEAPYLYRVNVGIESATQEPVAVYPPIRFGFREVWREGREMFLNDHPLKLRQAPFVGGPAAMYFLSGMGINAIEFQPNPAQWAVHPPLAFPSIPNPVELFDAADENGWIILMPTTNIAFYKGLMDQNSEEGYETWMAQVRLTNKDFDKQNRPSIIAWVPAMNQIGNGQNPVYTMDPAAIGRTLPPEKTPPWATGVVQHLKEEDPTRLVVYHEAGSTSDVHFGNHYMGNVQLQEREDWLSRWALDGDIPWGSAEFGPPTTAPAFKHRLRDDTTADGIPYFTELYAEYLGRSAYADETDVFIDDVAAAAADTSKAHGWGDVFQKVQGMRHLAAYYDHEAGKTVPGSTACDAFYDLFVRNTNKSWRAWGANAGWHPWIQDIGFGNYARDPHAANRSIDWTYSQMENDPEYRKDDDPSQLDPDKLRARPVWANSIYDVHHDTLQPLLVFIGGPDTHFTAKDHNYSSGEAAEHTIVVVWDGPGSTSVSVDWSLVREDGVTLGAGLEEFDMAAGTVERRPITLPVVSASNRTNCQLALDARQIG